MKIGPDIARIAVLIGDPARANMLTALSSGAALTASELAAEAGVTKQTASAHLAKLLDAELLAVESQGRHRYFRLHGEDVGDLLESLMGVAAQRGTSRVRTGPREPALRRARVCYDHLAGDLGVSLFDAMRAGKWITVDGQDVTVPKTGRTAFAAFGIDVAELETVRRPLCRTCLDWSVRRSHLAGTLGAAILDRIFELGWAKRAKGTRVVDFTTAGERAFTAQFKLQQTGR
ncbi:MAG: winged helix-turn-helix domain-containing protein [Alphaproteobacteria bacterium]|jgi:DNA-binding transcriptional ArsR family regulator|nr:winged helix-turn-helix domain-containing protein [Alphaproteobacteria bacterium]